MTDSSHPDGLSRLSPEDSRTADTLFLAFVGVSSGPLFRRRLLPLEGRAGVGFWKRDQRLDAVSSSSESLSRLSFSGTREVRERWPVERAEFGVPEMGSLFFGVREGVVSLGCELEASPADVLACGSRRGVVLVAGSRGSSGSRWPRAGPALVSAAKEGAGTSEEGPLLVPVSPARRRVTLFALDASTASPRARERWVPGDEGDKLDVAVATSAVAALFDPAVV